MAFNYVERLDCLIALPQVALLGESSHGVLLRPEHTGLRVFQSILRVDQSHIDILLVNLDFLDLEEALLAISNQFFSLRLLW